MSSWTAAKSPGQSLDRGVVFQGHALMPWLTVMGNIAFAVQSRWPMEPHRCRSIAQEASSWLVGLTGADRQEAGRALRRHEAARRHRAGLRHPAEDAAARRAVRRARRADARHDPGRAGAHLRRDAPDGLHDHARRRRGHPAGRPDPAHDERARPGAASPRSWTTRCRARAARDPPRPALLPNAQPHRRFPREPPSATRALQEREAIVTDPEEQAKRPTPNRA